MPTHQEPPKSKRLKPRHSYLQDGRRIWKVDDGFMRGTVRLSRGAWLVYWDDGTKEPTDGIGLKKCGTVGEIRTEMIERTHGL